MHFLYILGRGSQWEDNELRFSLRSISKNCPVSGVTLVGHCPKWVTGVEWVPVQNIAGDKIARVARQTISGLPYCPEELVLMNDDVYVMEPTPELELYHQGPLIDQYKFGLQEVPEGLFTAARGKTLDVLQEYGQIPYDYDLHVPMPVLRSGMFTIAALWPIWEGFQFRTLYGNYWGRQGERMNDVKDVWGKKFFSTESIVSEDYKAKLAAAFPDPSPFELQ
jgi:hypothetical protein